MTDTLKPAELDLEALKKRYTPEPIPPCRVCGAPLTIARAGGGAATEYACSAAKPPGEWIEHYERSRFTHYRPGDLDVLSLLTRIEALEAERDEANRQRCLLADRALAEAQAGQAAEAQRDRMREALEPFAAAANDIRPDDADTMRPAIVQAVHFRRAAEVCAALSQGTGGSSGAGE